MEKYNGYVVKVYRDKNIYSLTYGDERSDMEYNPTICPPDTPVPPQPEPTKKLTQSIIWTQSLSELYVGESIELIAYATSALPVTFQIVEGGTNAHLVGNVLTADKEGGIIVMASQSGDDNYYAADNVTKVINVKVQPTPTTKKEQTISWNQIISIHEGEEIDLVATSTSGLPVSFSIASGAEYAQLDGRTLKGIKEGTVTVRAYQLGNNEYKSATPINKAIYIQKAVQPSPTKQDQLITWEQSFDVHVGDTITLNASASSGLPILYVVELGNELVTLNGNVLKANATGVVMVSATQSGNSEYNPATSVKKGFTIGEKQPQVGGGYLILQFDKNYEEEEPHPYNSLKVTLPQNGADTVMWQQTDLKSFINSATAYEGIVTVTIPFDKLTGDLGVNFISTIYQDSMDGGDEFVMGAYFRPKNATTPIDFVNVHSLYGSFASLYNAEPLFNTVDGNIINTQNITSLSGMYSNCMGVGDIYMSQMDFSNVTTFEDMFLCCFELGIIRFNGTTFNTSATYTNMFKHCGRDVDNVNVYMSGCTEEAIEFIRDAWTASGNDINKLIIHS